MSACNSKEGAHFACASVPEAEDRLDSMVTAEEGTCSTPPMYFTEYEGNGSKKWDGKVIAVDSVWPEGLCQQYNIRKETLVKLPWTKAGGATEYWNARVVDEPASSSTSTSKSEAGV